MIRVLEFLVPLALIVVVFFQWRDATCFIRRWRWERKHAREAARAAFVFAVDKSTRASASKTLAIYYKDLSKYERAVLEEMKTDLLLEEEENNVKR